MVTAGKDAATNVNGYDFIKQKMKSLDLLENMRGEEELLSLIGKCLNCGVCLPNCPVLEATSCEDFSGPRSVAMALSRTNPSFWNVKDIIYSCTECGSCEETCPEKVPVPEAVSMVRARIFRLRPDLIPAGHKEMLNNLNQCGTSIPPEDDDLRCDLAESAMKDLNLPYKKDIFKDSAEVVYFAGCLSTHRALEIRESGKLILDKFGADFTLTKNETCCGLPARLIGDADLAERLAKSAIEQVRRVGASTIVTTCSGCANTLQASLHELEPGNSIRTKHLIEYLVEDVGIGKISKIIRGREPKQRTSEKIAFHSACHLSKHLSRRIQDYAVELLKAIPSIEITTPNTRQKCCGAGGLLSAFRPDVSRKITQARLREILEQGKKPEKIVAPCPTCMMQLGQEVFTSLPEVKVEDLTVLLAKKII